MSEEREMADDLLSAERDTIDRLNSQLVAMTAERNQLRNENMRLQQVERDLIAVSVERDALREAHRLLRSDINHIAARLREEAVSRGWCSEYGDFIADVNSELSEPILLPMYRKVSFTINVDDTTGTDETLDRLAGRLREVTNDYISGTASVVRSVGS